MPAFKFLFGKERGGSQATIGDRLKNGAHSQLHGKIIRAPLNRWWAVLLRHYLLWPIIKIPLLPVVEAMHARRKFQLFDRARDVLADAGFKSRINIVAPLRHAFAKKSGYLPALRNTIREIVWKQKARPGRENVGYQLMAEKGLCLKLFMVILTLWTVSVGVYAYAVVRSFHEGLHLILKDASHFFSGDILLGSIYGQSGSFKIWLFSMFLWSMALVLSFVLVNRPWMKLTDYVKDFLKSSGAFKGEDVDTKMVAIALPDVIFLSSPSVSIGKIRGLSSGWPGNFQVGEIIENSKKQEDLLVLRRPEKKPIVFGGDNVSSDILSHLKAYENHILSVMKDAIKKPSDSELIFLGEVIESRWWQSSAIYKDLANSPHVFICGQTRSGKTKSVLSFVYTFARAYPDTQWVFADGKGSQDYDPFAEYLSIFPVGKPDERGDPLIQMANIVDYVWSEYARRRALFTKATMDGKPCSTIYQYRETVGPLPQVFLVIDEFSVFLNEMSFESNWRTDGTIANRLKRLAAEAASVGIHLVFATQRYQVTDMPSVMRSNLTTRMVHNVQLKDADLLETPEATKLDSGQFYVTAAGLWCQHTGISKVRAKLPYIGHKPDILLSQTVKPIARELKKEFDQHLIYNKGSDDLEKMTVTELCMRLQRFFRDQDYHTTELVQDLEATELQLDLVKAKKEYITKEDGQIITELRPIPGAPRVGISVLRADEVDEETILGIQAKYNTYSAVMIFVLGKTIQASKYKFVGKINELSTRFCIVPFREYFKDMRFVEMKRKQGQAVDVIQPKLQRLGLADVSHAVAAKGILASDLTAKSPVKLKISKILEIVRLDKSQSGGELRGIPYTASILPGGTELYFLIVAGKTERDDAKEIAMSMCDSGKAVIIVSSEKFNQTDIKQMGIKGVQIWRTSQIDEVLEKLKSKEAQLNFVGDLMMDLRLIKGGGSATNANVVTIGPQAKIILACALSPDASQVIGCRLTCEITGYTIVMFPKIEIERFRLDYLGIPETAKITVVDGLAPLGADPAKVKVKYSSKGRPVSFPAASRWEVFQGILQRKKDSITSDDPLLAQMQKKTI